MGSDGLLYVICVCPLDPRSAASYQMFFFSPPPPCRCRRKRSKGWTRQTVRPELVRSRRRLATAVKCSVWRSGLQPACALARDELKLACTERNRRMHTSPRGRVSGPECCDVLLKGIVHAFVLSPFFGGRGGTYATADHFRKKRHSKQDWSSSWLIP